MASEHKQPSESPIMLIPQEGNKHSILIMLPFLLFYNIFQKMTLQMFLTAL